MVSLTKVESEIMHHLQRMISMNQKVTLSILAGECHVAPSTIVKVAKKMGYSGFVEFYYHVRSQYAHTKESLPFDQDLVEGDMVVQMDEIVDLMWRHRRHKNFIHAASDNDILSTYFSRKLAMFDYLAPATYDYVMAQSQILPHGLAFFLETRKQFHPYLEEMLDIAKKENFYIIMLADGKDAWIQRHSDLCITIKKTNRKGSDFYPAKVLMWVEMLVSAYAKRCMEERENA